MARLPSSADVPTISPRVAADPGVRAPVEAFESPIGVAAQEFAPAADKLAQVALRQEDRRDTVDRSKQINDKNAENQEKLLELKTKGLLGEGEGLTTYGEFLSEQRQSRLQAHRESGASKDSLATLETRLLDVDSVWTGKAAALSTTAGRDKAIQAFDDSVAPIIGGVANLRPSATRQAVEQAFSDIDTQIGDLEGIFDPSEKEGSRSAKREEVVLTALNSLIDRDFVETAEALLDEGGLAVDVSPQAGITMRRRIAATRSAKDDAMSKIREAEQILGRSLTENETLQFLGLAPKMTERQRVVENLTGRGMSSNLSNDIANGLVKVLGPDNFGNFFSVNIATNEMQQLSAEDSAAIAKSVKADQGGQQAPETQAETQAQAPQAQAQQQEIPAIEKAALIGTGPFAKIRAGISNIFGPFIEGAIQQDTTDARQQLRVFNQVAKIGLVNSPRFNQKEQDIVQNLLPDPEAFFRDPDRTRNDLKQLGKQLNRMKVSKEKELQGAKITSKRAGELYDNISRINELLTLLAIPSEPDVSQETPADVPENLPEGIPEGSEFIGTSVRGNPVWQTVDGKRLEVLPGPTRKLPSGQQQTEF